MDGEPRPERAATARVPARRSLWREYTRRYKSEIAAESSPFDERNKTIKNLGQKFTLRLIEHLSRQGNVTLLCHCDEDETQCHRHLLKAMIEQSAK